MTNRIVVSVGRGKLQEALLEAKAADSADVIEIRLDLIQDSAVQPFLSQLKKPLIFTNRAEWEGGEFQGDEKQRIAPLLEAIGGRASYVDLELLAPQQSWESMLDTCKGTSSKIICSWHNFVKTPSDEELQQKLQEMIDCGAHIGKIVTLASSSLDVIRVLALQDEADKCNFPLIAFCMGETGVISRVATGLLGGYMTYCAPDSGKSVAPGQISVSAMRSIHEQMKR